MPEVKKKIPLLGQDMEVAEVPVVKADEPWSRYELEDGSVIRHKAVVTSIARLEGQYNPADGKPIYLVLTSPVVVVESVPDRLIKKV
ncbi:MAG: hypothetical protein ACLP3K_10055 [Candidatus Acidiferrales bacterium]